MAPTLRPIKNNSSGSPTVIESLAAFIFQDINAGEYLTNRTYNAGDRIVRLNTTLNKFEILKCTTNGTTGTYNAARWSLDTITKTLEKRIADTVLELNNNKATVVEDMTFIISSLLPYFQKPINLNHIYVDDFRDSATLTITSGVFTPGKIII